MAPETQGKLLYAAIGAALDCKATPQQIVELFTPDKILRVIELITKKAQP